MKPIFTVVLALTLALPVVAQNPQVAISNGQLEGTFNATTGINSYKGIPYALPPVGNLRWKAPQPPANWSGVLKADHFSHMPMQKRIYSDMIFRADTMSEDCLYLNVWTPAKSAYARLPVLVYFYGGGFSAGDGSEARYDGESLAQKGIVTVTVNYRLGIFGFFAHPELSAETSYHGSGNYGLMDQSAALVWVKKNIAAFGGDPDHITIAGESAGSIAVFGQMASPLSRNLIAGAIGESGAMIKPTLPALSLADGEQIGLTFQKKIDAKSLADLRALTDQPKWQQRVFEDPCGGPARRDLGLEAECCDRIMCRTSAVLQRAVQGEFAFGSTHADFRLATHARHEAGLGVLPLSASARLREQMDHRVPTARYTE